MSAFIDKAHQLLFPHYRVYRDQFPAVPFDGIVGIVSQENSSINPTARRFERHVYNAALAVQQGGRSTAFPGFNTGKLRDYILGCDRTPVKVTNPPGLGDLTFQRGLVALCSSHGIGQLMGWHFVEKWGFTEGDIWLHTSLKDQMLYVMRFYEMTLKRPDVSTYEQLLRAWNTGSPNGKTHHPDYVANAVKFARDYEKKYGNGRTDPPGYVQPTAPAPATQPGTSFNERLAVQLDKIIEEVMALHKMLGTRSKYGQ